MGKKKSRSATVKTDTTRNCDAATDASLSDQRRVQRIVASGFEVTRQSLKKIRKEHPERKHILEGTEMVEPFYSRRIKAATNYLPVMVKRFEKHQNVEPDDFAVFFAQPTCNIASLDTGGSLCTGAALWILDTLRACRKMQKLYENIPWLPDDDPTEMPAIYDSCHSDENIKGLVFIIQSWFERKLRLDTSTGSSTAVEKARHDPTTHFSAIMELIPEEAKNRAVNRLEDKVWEWADIYLSVLDDIIGRRLQVEKKINVLDDELGELTEKLKLQVKKAQRSQKDKPAGSTTASVKAPLIAPFAAPLTAPLTAPDNDILGVLGTYQNAILGRATTSELKTPLDAPMQLIRRIEKLENERRAIIEEERSLRMWAPGSFKTSTKKLTEKLGADNAEKFINFRVGDPFEMCFAFLCLLDRDDDIAWLYSFTLAVMDAACGQLPWAKGDYDEEEDTIWHPQDFFEMLLNDDSDEVDYSEDRHLDDDWFGLKYTMNGVDEEANERASIAQIVYQLTGAIIPRNTYRYDSLRKQLRRGGLPNTKIDRAISAMMVLGEVQRRSRNWLFDGFSFDDLVERQAADDAVQDESASSDMADTIEKLKAENAALKKENDRLRQATHAAHREVKESQQSIEKLEREAEEHTQELADLRELVFNQQNGEYEKSEKSENSEIEFPYETKRRIVVFGGHDSWLREIRQKLPKVRFVDRGASPNADLIRNADVIWIQANSMQIVGPNGHLCHIRRTV